MKYKRLTFEELQALEKEFVQFLASAQVTAKDWEQMKTDAPGKANEFIDVFSDVVYDNALKKIKFLEYRDVKTLNIFNCTGDKIILVGLRVNQNSVLDLTSPDVFTNWNNNNTSAVKLIRTEKNYSKEREMEVFELLQSGCLITDDKLFELLSGMT